MQYRNFIIELDMLCEYQIKIVWPSWKNWSTRNVCDHKVLKLVKKMEFFPQ
jgi:hypothetical protein